MKKKRLLYLDNENYKKFQMLCIILNKSDKRNNATNEELKKSKKELRNAQMKYRQYSKSNGIDVDYELTWVAKYNK